MKAIITVPKPCNEDWDAMQPNQQGRHCDLCALTVVDFTGWPLPHIAAYLKANSGSRVCGRFQRKQLNQPFDLKILVPKVIGWNTWSLRKMSALIIVCFALATTSCRNNVEVVTSGEPLMETPAAFLKDTVIVEPQDTTAVIPPLKKERRKTSSAKKQDVGVVADHDVIMGGAFGDVGYNVVPVKASPKFQPPIGPPEYDSTQTP